MCRSEWGMPRGIVYIRRVNFDMRYMQSEGRPLDDELADKRAYDHQAEIDMSVQSEDLKQYFILSTRGEIKREKVRDIVCPSK